MGNIPAGQGVVGTLVQAHGLRNSAHLNDRGGTVTGVQGDRVIVDFGRDLGSKALRPTNLRSIHRAFCHGCAQVVRTVLATGEDELVACSQCGECAVEVEDTGDTLAPPAPAFGGAPMDPQNLFGGAQMGGVPGVFPAGVDPRIFAAAGANGPAFVGQDLPFHGFGLPAGWEQFLQMQGDQPQTPPPASEAAVRKLKRWTVAKEEDLKDCVVCQADFAEGDAVVKMPCEHIFHDDCLLRWLKDNNTCPTCRKDLPRV